MSTCRPSSRWQGFGDEMPDSSELFQRISHVLTTADFNFLASVAVDVRRSLEGLTANITCSIDPSLFSYGFHHVAVEIAFSDDVYWVARIQHKPAPSDTDEAEAETTNMLSEITTMNVVRARTRIPVPRIYGHQSQPSENFAYPYVLMEYLEGHTLPSSIARAVPREKLPFVARQIAEVLFELENLKFDKLGRVWCGRDGQESPRIIATTSDNRELSQSSLEWLLADRLAINDQALEQYPSDPEWRAACEVLKLALQDVVIEDRLHGPFPVCHVDFHYGNLLFDDDYILRGIIDWDGAQTVPLEKMACSPEFMTFPAWSVQKNEPIVYFRNLVRDSLEKLEISAASGELEGRQRTMLSAIIGTPCAEVVHRATYTSWRRTVWDAKHVSKIMWGDSLSWEDIAEKYGRVKPATEGLKDN